MLITSQNISSSCIFSLYRTTMNLHTVLLREISPGETTTKNLAKIDLINLIYLT